MGDRTSAYRRILLERLDELPVLPDGPLRLVQLLLLYVKLGLYGWSADRVRESLTQLTQRDALKHTMKKGQGNF